MSLVSRIHSAAADFLIKRLAEKGLPDFASSHGFILFQLAAEDALTMKELADKINRDKSTATVLVRKLERDGFVKTAPAPGDARSKLVSLTRKGKALQEKAKNIPQKAAGCIALSPDKARKLYALLYEVLKNEGEKAK